MSNTTTQRFVTILFAVIVYTASPVWAQPASPFPLGTVSPLMTQRSLFKAVTGTFERLDQFAYRPPADGCTGKRSQIWSDFDLTYADQKTTAENNAYTEWGSTGIYGIDTHPTRDTMIGINLGMTLAESRSPDLFGIRERDTLINVITSIYGMRYNAGWSLKAMIGYSYNDYKLKIDDFSDHHVGNGLHGSVELAKRFRFGQTLFSPYYSFTAMGLYESAYREIYTSKRDTSRYTQKVGLRIGRDFFLPRDWILYPHLDVAWQHNYDNKSYDVLADGIVLATARPYADLINIGTGLNFVFNSNLWAYCRYDVEFAKDTYIFNVLTGGFVWTY
ncbi:MAG: autotransporter outer membrane beta-barrel domain-containing protein [Thermoguttaceae bacterium]